MSILQTVHEQILWKCTLLLSENNDHRIKHNYHHTSNISRTLLWNKMVDHSDVVGASPVGAAPTISSFST